MKRFPLIAAITAIALAACSRSSTTTKEDTSRQPVPPVYRDIKPEDGIRFTSKIFGGETIKNGVWHGDGFHLYVIAGNGKEREIALVSNSVDDQLQTKEFGTLKMKATTNSFTLFGTDSQILKLRQFQESGVISSL